MISESIQFLAGIQWIFFSPPIIINQNRIACDYCWKSRLDNVIAECYLKLMVMLMMARDESFGWNEAEVPLKTVFLLFPSISEPLSHLFVIAKNNCQPLLQCLYASRV